MTKENKLWYFTFGINTPNEEYAQPVIASDSVRARDLMFDRHGTKWAFQYSEEEWVMHLRDSDIGFDRLIEFETLGSGLLYNTEWEKDIIKCPYCGNEEEASDVWEFDNGGNYEVDCSNCERFFNVEVSMHIDYYFETETIDEELTKDE